MDSFGLGLVLNFVDNASAGMRGAVSTFQQLNGAADSVTTAFTSNTAAAQNLAASGALLNGMGEGLVSMGESVVGAFTGVTKSILDTGMTFNGYRMQLDALYQNMDGGGAAAFTKIQNYALDTAFAFEDLLGVVTTFKMAGIEALDTVTSSSGQSSQALLSYASDLVGMMPNLVGGMNTAAYAIKEFVAEGNTMSLTRRLSIDIEQMLGQEKGGTPEERLTQIADMLEQLNIVGYTEKLFGTPQQVLANLGDYVTIFKDDVASTEGVLDSYSNIVSTLGDFVRSLTEDTDRYGMIVGIVSNVISSFLVILERVLNYVITIANAILDWVSRHQELAASILKFIVVLGGLSVGVGMFLKLAGGIMQVLAAMKFLGLSFGKIGLSMLTHILPLIAIFGILIYAWKTDLNGFQTWVKQKFAAISLIFDALFDNTLSGENMDLAQKMGLLPLIETVLDLKSNLTFLWEGLKTGFGETLAGALTTVSTLISSIFGGNFDTVKEKVLSFIQGITGWDMNDKWTSAGEVIGGILAKMIVLLPVIALVVKVFSVMSMVIGLAKGAFTLLSQGISFILSPAGLVVIAVLLLIATFVYLWNTSEAFRAQVATLFEALSTAFGNLISALQPLQALWDGLIVPLGQWAAEVLIIALVVIITAVTFLVECFNALYTEFAGVYNFITGATDDLSTFGKILLAIAVAVAIVGAAILVYKTIMGIVTLVTNIASIATAAWGVVVAIATSPITLIVLAIAAVAAGVYFLVEALGGSWAAIRDWCTEALNAVAGFFADIWNGIKNFFGLGTPKEVAAETGRDLKDGIVEGVESDGSAQKVTNSVESIMPTGLDFSSDGASIGSTLTSGILGELDSMQLPAQTSVTDTLTGITGDFDMSTLLGGSEAGAAGIEGLLGGITDFDMNTPMTETGSGMMESLMGGMDSFDFAGAMGETGDSLLSTFNTDIGMSGGANTETFNSGVAFTTGFVDGLESVPLDTAIATFDTAISGINTAVSEMPSFWATMRDETATIMSELSSNFTTTIDALKTAMDFTWKLPEIKVPTINISYSTTKENIKIPSFSVSWNAAGGIFDSPTILNSNAGLQGVGEAGAEAIIPLSTLWDEMSTRLDRSMRGALGADASLQPTVVVNQPAPAKFPQSTIPTGNTNITNNNVSGSPQAGTQDNRVIFEKGSVVVELASTGDADMEEAADKLMKIMARKMQKNNLASRKNESIPV